MADYTKPKTIGSSDVNIIGKDLVVYVPNQMASGKWHLGVMLSVDTQEQHLQVKTIRLETPSSIYSQLPNRHSSAAISDNDNGIASKVD